MVHEQSGDTERPPRARRREARTEEILDVAERLLDQGGMHALTMQELARALGTTVGATYRYFESKEAIVATLQRRVLERLRTDLEHALSRHAAVHPRPSRVGALTRVGIAARILVTLPVRRPTHARLLGCMLAEPDEVLPEEAGRANVSVALALASVVVRELEVARVAGALGPGDDLERAWLLWSSLAGLVQTRKLARWDVPGLDVDVLAERLVTTLLVGWGADRARAHDAWARAGDVVGA